MLNAINIVWYCWLFPTANIRLEKIGRSAINFVVIGLSTLSLFLCCRAIYRAQLLKAVEFYCKLNLYCRTCIRLIINLKLFVSAVQIIQEVVQFFKKYFSKDLTVNERITFLNFWYLLIIFNDILIIIGSGIKEEIENKVTTSYLELFSMFE